MIEFTDEEVGWLRAIVVDWINDGFTTPPYEEDIYSIFEKLDIHNDIPFPLHYDVNRPKPRSSNQRVIE